MTDTDIVARLAKHIPQYAIMADAKAEIERLRAGIDNWQQRHSNTVETLNNADKRNAELEAAIQRALDAIVDGNVMEACEPLTQALKEQCDD